MNDCPMEKNEAVVCSICSKPLLEADDVVPSGHAVHQRCAARLKETTQWFAVLTGAKGIPLLISGGS